MLVLTQLVCGCPYFFGDTLEFLLGMLRGSSPLSRVFSSGRNYPSARPTSAANVVYRDVDVFGAKTVSLDPIL
jgi:hypothetical protein